MKFNFIDIDKSVLPTAKGRRKGKYRFYEVNGTNYPSVTSVLGVRKKVELQQWRDRIGENVANWEMGRAARRGTATHNLIENYIKGEPLTEKSVLPLGLFKLMKPYIDQIQNIHCLETVLYSEKYKLAGQVDCIAEYNGKLSVIDFKTANKERKEEWIDNYFMQCTAYGLMYEEMYNTEIEDIVVIMGGEDGSMVTYVKKKADYISKLEEVVEDFYKMFNLEYNEQQLS
jgi:genome maintenance exonuclease 1